VVYKSYLAHLLIAVTMAIFCFASCDSYNIVEPRFYSEEDIVDVQWEDASHTWLNISFTLPFAGPYKLYVLGSAGNIVRSYEGMGNTGLNVITWDRKDNNGGRVEKGVYAILLKADNLKTVTWFEID
jgi:hypothetical protein